MRSAKRQFLKRLLILQLVAVLTATMLALVVPYLAFSEMHKRAEVVSVDSKVAVLSADAEAHMSALIEIMTRRAATFLTSPDVLALPEADQATLHNALIGQITSVASPDLAAMQIPLSLTEAIQFQQSLSVLEPVSQSLLPNGSSPEDDAVRAQVQETMQILTRYFVQPTVANFEGFLTNLREIRDSTQAAIPDLITKSTQSLDSFTGLTNQARIGIAVLIMTLGFCVLGVTLLAARRIRKSMEMSQDEREQLADAGERLRYRNNQLAALYNVFNEITDTLSLRYVVNSTVKEARNLVKADLVVLRLISDNKLVVAGSLDALGNEVHDLDDVDLGEGPVGRVAKRGRSIKIDRDAYDTLTDGQRVRGLRSGVIVPLIVGARIRGTLGCWANRDDAFNDDDVRILEMMASQVATAVAAADTNETSERRAHHDALTGLPNRHQMESDLTGELNSYITGGGPAVVAMLDIDQFKRFNDDFGHRVGDVTLQKVGAVLRSSVREGDKVYRIGGEEFLIVFMNALPAEAVPLAERVRDAVASTPLTGDSLEPVGPVTISIGLALAPGQSRDLNELIELADQSLYEAKSAGRNRVFLSDRVTPVRPEGLQTAA